jgi:hypothetical protein
MITPYQNAPHIDSYDLVLRERRILREIVRLFGVKKKIPL